jgi:hypothetical protein
MVASGGVGDDGRKLTRLGGVFRLELVVFGNFDWR